MQIGNNVHVCKKIICVCFAFDQVPCNSGNKPIRGIRSCYEVRLGTKTFKSEHEDRVTAKQSAHIEALLKTKYRFNKLPELLQPYSIPTLGKRSNLSDLRMVIKMPTLFWGEIKNGAKISILNLFKIRGREGRTRLPSLR